MKKQFVCMLLLTGISVTNAFTQPVIKNQKIMGGDFIDGFSCMTRTTDGGYLLGGSSLSNISGEKTENSHGAQDYWIVKLDAAGAIQWDKTIGGNNTDGLTCLQQTSDGGYVLGGDSWSGIGSDKTENNRGEGDYWIVKLDNTGTKEWDKTIGGSKTDYMTCLQQTNDGGYIIGGYSYSNKSGEKTQDRRGGNNTDYWIVKLDNTGAIQWDKTIGGNDYDLLSSIHQTNDGGYILGGYSNSNSSWEKTENNRGNYYDYWIVKLDKAGNIQWDKTIGGALSDHLSALIQTSDGGYMLGGYSSSNISGEKTENTRSGFDDYWIVKLDAAGAIQWDKTIGGNSFDELTCLQQTGDDGYILGGYSSSDSSWEKTENNRGIFSTRKVDYWVVKLNAKGKIQWDKTIGGSGDDNCISILETGKNKYLVGGYSSSDISGDKTKRNHTSDGVIYQDYWLVSLYNKTGGNSSEAIVSDAIEVTPLIDNKKSFSIYPNPAKDILHIQSTGKATFTLTNQSGKILLTKTINGSGEINISQLPAGLYYLKNNETGAVQKVMTVK